MTLSSFAATTLDQEARGLLTRLARVKPFALIMPAVAAANISRAAATAIEEHLVTGRRELSSLVHMYLQWLRGPEGRRAEPAEAQRRLSILRLKFNAVLTQFDIFADALIQRCEYENGVWLSGLDLLAADALALPGGQFVPPPVIIYLDRGHGAAIRRARTRLPGGGKNPVAIIRIPRERMVGSGIASSLVHEVGHQGAALLGLIDSMRAALLDEQRKSPTEHRMAWDLWQRWISEILADFWSVAKVGVAATQGLMGVVSLPRAFVFRINVDDPHPVPWIRVKLSTAIGQALYPHPQWVKLSRLWDAFYPKAGLDTQKLHILRILKETKPRFVKLLINHRPKSLGGKTIRQAFSLAERQPDRLAALYERWHFSPTEMVEASPVLVFAVLGQAKQDRKIIPAEESRIVAKLLTHWALGRAKRPLSYHNTRRHRRSSSQIMTAAAP
jgi:hypothetical protein